MTDADSRQSAFYRLIAVVVLALGGVIVLHLAPDSVAAKVIAVVFSIVLLLELLEPVFWLLRKLR